MGLGNSALDTIVHPDLHAALNRFFPACVTIQRATVTLKANGEQVHTWSDYLRDLRGNFAQRPTAERRGAVMTTVPGGWSLNLMGHYPGIEKTDRAIVDDKAFNIVDVVHDSLGQSTRLDLERTTH